VEHWGRALNGSCRHALERRPKRSEVHARGRGPGDSFSLPYFEVDDLPAALAQVATFGGSVVYPGEKWVMCKDSEGSPSDWRSGLGPELGRQRRGADAHRSGLAPGAGVEALDYGVAGRHAQEVAEQVRRRH
jgi:hypothetical protein